MKAGRVGKEELNLYADLLEVAMRARPTSCCGIVVAPYLTSEKVTNGLRGEIRRCEDKLDAKGIMSQLFTIRCAEPPANKKVPLFFPAWVTLHEAGVESNAFRACQLIADRTHISPMIPFVFFSKSGMASLFKTPQRYLKYTIYIPTLQHTPIFLGVALCQSLIGFRQTVRGSIVSVPCLAHGVPQLVLCFEGALAKMCLGNANRRMLCPMLPRMPYRMRQKE